MGHEGGIGRRANSGDLRQHLARLPRLARTVVEEGVERRVGFDRHRGKGQAGGVEATAPLARQHPVNPDALRGQRRADAARLPPPFGGEIALRGAVTDAEAGWIPESGFGLRMPQKQNDAAGAQG